MEETTSREKVLKKVRNALISKTEPPFSSLDIESSVYAEIKDSSDIIFAQEFTKVAGKFIYCENETDLKDYLTSLVSENEWKNVFSPEPRIKEIFKK